MSIGAAGLAALGVIAAAVLPAPTRAAFPGANGKIAFTSDRDGSPEVYVMGADGAGVGRLGAAGDAPSFSGDGRRIAFATSRVGFSEVFAMNADGSGQTNLTSTGGDDVDPSFSADGTRIAYARNAGGGSFDIFAMNADGSGAVNLTSHPEGELAPAFSPAGGRIAFVRSFDVLLMNADGTGQVNLTNSDTVEVAPSFSPDGGRIVFGSDRDGNPEIYSMNPDGTNVVRLTNESAADDEPSYSPDGTKIAFRSERDGNAEIYVMNADGSAPVNVTNSPAADSQPDWGVLVPADPTPTPPPSTPPPSGATTTPIPATSAPPPPAAFIPADTTAPPRRMSPPQPLSNAPSASPPPATGGAAATAPGRRAQPGRRAAASPPPAPQRRSVAIGHGGTPMPAAPSQSDDLRPSANPRRSDLSTYFVRPDNLFLSAEDIRRSVGIAVLLALLLGLPTRLFNGTVRSNRAELLAFFRPVVTLFAGITPRAARRALGFAGVSALVAAAVYAFLDPRFPNRPGAAPYALGMLVGVGVIILTRLLSARSFMARRMPGVGGGWVVYTGQIAVLATCVAVSRLAHLAPGLLLGMAGDYESRKPMTPAQDAAASTVTYGVRLVVSLAAWFASIPAAHAAEQVGASSWLLALDVALSVIALVGMQSVVFALIPLMFLDGYNLLRERRGVWFAYWATGVLWLAIVVINPALTHQGERAASVPWLAGLLGFQALIAVGLWGFFRMRRRTAAGRSAVPA